LFLVAPCQQQKPLKMSQTVTTQPGSGKDFNTGLFDVCADTKTAACALLNPLFGCGLAKRMGEPCLAGCGGQVAMRAVYRTKNGIDGDICMDLVWSSLCGPCAACQLSRALDADGAPENWWGIC